MESESVVGLNGHGVREQLVKILCASTRRHDPNSLRQPCISCDLCTKDRQRHPRNRGCTAADAQRRWRRQRQGTGDGKTQPCILANCHQWASRDCPQGSECAHSLCAGWRRIACVPHPFRGDRRCHTAPPSPAWKTAPPPTGKPSAASSCSSRASCPTASSPTCACWKTTTAASRSTATPTACKPPPVP